MAQITGVPGAQGRLQSRPLADGKQAFRATIPAPHRLIGLVPAAPAPGQSTVQAGRLAGIDALRGGAMLLGVFIHAAISYIPSNLAELIWGIREETTSPVLAALFWWIHTFRLPLFFLIAGFFSVLVYDTKGPRAFLAHRLRRLVVPLVVGIAVLLPLTYLYFWSCGVVNGRVSDAEIESFEIEPQVQARLFGPMHLWFLEDLLILSLIAWAAWRLRDGLSGNKSPAARAQAADWPAWVSALAPLALAVPAALIVWTSCAPVIAHRNSFVPDVGRLVYYGLFFACGAAVHRYRAVLPQVFAWPSLHLALSVVAAVGLLWLLPTQFTGQADAASRLAFASCAALVAWLSVFGLMGFALRSFHGRHPTVHYLADASYWIYLFHMPLVCLMQLNLFGLPLGPELKCCIVIGTAVALGLATYQTMVRYTVIGAYLHGPRTRP
jgi:glucan biosynthesis protein C